MKSYRQSRTKGFNISVLCFQETEKFGGFEGKETSLTDNERTISILRTRQIIHVLRSYKYLLPSILVYFMP